MTDTATGTSTEHLDLALRLHRAASPSVQRESCLSPCSIAAALSVAATASAGATRAELVQALTGDGDLDRLRADLSAASESSDAVLAVANTIWAREDIEIRTGLDGLDSAVRSAPFSSDPEAARALINADVAQTTRDLIPELIPRGALDAATVAAIVNALYLKTSWATPFSAGRTEPLPFHGAGEVDTMCATEKFAYAARENWQAVILKAAGGVQAAVLLPTDLASAEPELSASGIADLLDSAKPTRIDLALPKFSVRANVGLTSALATLGVHTMFGGEADFSPLTPAALYVSDVLHEAVLRIDENGLEGAAATSVMMKLAMMANQPEPIPVHVDRPFLFLVRHAETGVVYFLARVTHPQ